jgi:hypothetical protein
MLYDLEAEGLNMNASFEHLSNFNFKFVSMIITHKS